MRALPDVATLSNAGLDVRVLVRTDKSASGGSYNGLPQPLTQFQGATVIVDEPELVTAMNSGSYGALQYLDGALVEALARQVH